VRLRAGRALRRTAACVALPVGLARGCSLFVARRFYVRRRPRFARVENG
jgi:hypothetical protein